MKKQSMCIVIPAYDEERNIEEVIKKSFNWLKNQTKDYEILSKRYTKLKVIHHKKNLGIGEAWKTLYKNSTKDLIFTCPADQQFDPKDFSVTLPFIEKVDVISIYRKQKKQYGIFRNFLSNLNKAVIKLFFNFTLNDVNWVKVYKTNLLRGLDLKLSSPLVETEIIAKLKKRNAKIIEVAAPHHERIHGKGKGGNLKQLTKTSKDILRLYFIVKNFK